MQEKFKIYNRHSIRIKEYDYSTEGMYFITICTHNRKCILSKIIFQHIKNNVGTGPVSAQIKLTHEGNIIEKAYLDLEKEFINIKVHDYVIMPNHLHGIIQINQWADTGPAPTLSDIICSFKTRTTGQIIKQIKRGICKPFNKRFWQRNYYEHVIRNENELYEIQKYIQYNPLNWEKDKYNC